MADLALYRLLAWPVVVCVNIIPTRGPAGAQALFRNQDTAMVVARKAGLGILATLTR